MGLALERGPFFWSMVLGSAGNPGTLPGRVDRNVYRDTSRWGETPGHTPGIARGRIHASRTHVVLTYAITLDPSTVSPRERPTLPICQLVRMPLARMPNTHGQYPHCNQPRTRDRSPTYPGHPPANEAYCPRPPTAATTCPLLPARRTQSCEQPDFRRAYRSHRTHFDPRREPGNTVDIPTRNLPMSRRSSWNGERGLCPGTTSTGLR